MDHETNTENLTSLTAPVSPLRLAGWWSQMQKSKDDCRKIIQRAIDEDRTISDADFSNLAAQICDEVGKTMRLLLTDAWGTKSGDCEPVGAQHDAFCFYPGYNRYASETQGRLDTINQTSDEYGSAVSPADFAEAVVNEVRSIYLHDGQKTYSCFRLNVWMDLFYEQAVDEHVLYGFTKWLELHKQLALPSPRGDKLRHLAVIELGPKDDLSSDNPIEPTPGILTIPYELTNDPSEFFAAATAPFGRRQNLSPEDDSELYDFPPFGYDRHSPVNGSQAAGRRESDHSYAVAEHAARGAFSLLWHSIFFNPRKNGANFGLYTDPIVNQMKEAGLHQFAERAQLGLDTVKILDSDCPSAYWPGAFKFYYIIPLDRELELRGRYLIKPDLGTVNLYSNRRIPSYCLYMLKRWIESIYAKLRLAEALVNSKITATDEQLQDFAHRTLGIIESIHKQCADQNLFQVMEPCTRNLLTLLLTTVACYRNRPHEVSTEFEGIGDEPVKAYFDMAAADVYQRVLKARRDDMFNRVIELEDQGDWTRVLLREIGWDAVLEQTAFGPGLTKTIRTQSFGAMFVHALKQALYHTLLCKFEHPKLWQANPISLRATHADGKLSVEIRNPGKPPGERTVSRDAEELKRLASTFIRQGEVFGPVWHSGDRVWLTGFWMHVISNLGERA